MSQEPYLIKPTNWVRFKEWAADFLLEQIPGARPTWKFIKREGRGVKEGRLLFTVIAIMLVFATISVTRCYDDSGRPAQGAPLKLDLREHGVDDESRIEIAKLKQQLQDAQKQVRDANTRAYRAQLAARPKSLKERLRDTLDSIDPVITRQAIGGEYTYRNAVDIRKVKELQQLLASDRESARYVTLIVTRGGASGFTGNDGEIVSGVQEIVLTVEPELMQQP